ncbi:MAG TPA: 30S ribosomal protein S4 [Anaerolineae bacterium]|nr:30S ribosomal protein S4 [Anaerolineae bacterium]HIQ06477.1 30S ribosomal protein S4 [Anaerolineae bacterium]
MARYTGPVCKLCRREGEKLYLKGERCYTTKCAFERRSYPPGVHGQRAQFRRKKSDYGMQLREKQRARRVYGVLERQFRRYFAEAAKRKGMTGVTLLQLLESRLDNVVYRLGFAASRNQARQLVRHGHIAVNGRKVDIPSYLCKAGDIIQVRENSRQKTYFKDLMERLSDHTVPEWMSLDVGNLSGRVLSAPTREQIDIPLNEQLIVEYYSR